VSPRAKELSESLRREIDSLVSQGWSFERRRSWLLDQLDNYLDRWLGFAALGVPMKSLLRDDLFIMLVVGAEMYSSEVMTETFAEEPSTWTSFISLIAEVRERGDTVAFSKLRDALTQVRNDTLPKPG